MDRIKSLESEQMKPEIPDFAPGDTVRAWIKVVEGGKERLQAFEGICIKRNGGGLTETFTLRKISHGVGVERTLMLHSPRLDRLQVTRRGQVRRARLYFLRNRIGKRATTVKEKRLPIKE